MNRINKKNLIIFVLTLFFAYAFSVNQVFAVDNDDLANNFNCQITVGGVETSTSTDNPPNLFNDGVASVGRVLNAYKYLYEIEVCPGDFSVLSNDLLTYAGNGEPIAAHMSTSSFNFEFGSSRASTILLPNASGCLTGTFESGANDHSDFTIDVESKDSNAPICVREHGHLSTRQRDEYNESGYDEAVAQLCDLFSINPENPTIDQPTEVRSYIDNYFFTNSGIFSLDDGRTYQLDYRLKDVSGDEVEYIEKVSRTIDGLSNNTFRRTYDNLTTTIYTAEFVLTSSNFNSDDISLCSASFRVGTDLSPGGMTDTAGDESDYAICESNLNHETTAYSSCISCFNKKGIWTAIGCIDQKPKTMVSKLMTIGVGTLGGVFLLRVLAAAFILTTSQGDVKKTSEGKQMITEAVIGVLFILFSVTILQFIGADILKIPGFGS